MSYQPSPYKEVGVSASGICTQRPAPKRLDRGLYDNHEPKMPKYGHKFIHRHGHAVLTCYYYRGSIYVVADKKCKGMIR